MESSNALPIQQNQRIAIVDILRGWALLGVVSMNYADAYFLGVDFKNFKPGISENIVMGFTQIVFSAKSWTMLSLYFFSFHLFDLRTFLI